MKTILFIARYIKYVFTAKNQHIAHSPFLYQFITKVLNKTSNDRNCNEIIKLRKKLCNSNETIQISDFGAGSHINKAKKRKIKDVAKNSSKNKKFGELLYRITKYYNPLNIIELGTSFGISTLYLAKGGSRSNVYTFEGCPETTKIAKKNFKEMNVKNVYITIGNFKYTLQKKLKEIQSVDLVFIDGNHKEKPTIEYFKNCLKYANNNTIFILDDIHWSEGMEKAWENIKSHHRTTLTIDLFYVGIVYIKSELSKENYTIRF